jgi:hypothetical protein
MPPENFSAHSDLHLLIKTPVSRCGGVVPGSALADTAGADWHHVR